MYLVGWLFLISPVRITLKLGHRVTKITTITVNNNNTELFPSSLYQNNSNNNSQRKDHQEQKRYGAFVVLSNNNNQEVSTLPIDIIILCTGQSPESLLKDLCLDAAGIEWSSKTGIQVKQRTLQSISTKNVYYYVGKEFHSSICSQCYIYQPRDGIYWIESYGLYKKMRQQGWIYIPIGIGRRHG